MNKPKLLIIGPTPPPYHGVSLATETLLQSNLASSFQLIYLNTSDGRDVSHVDKPDLYDAWQFFRQWVRNLVFVLRERPALYYLPICQTRLGFFRDSLFLLPAIMVGSRIVLHLHGGYPFEQVSRQAGPFWQEYMALFLRRVSRFVVLGEIFRPIFYAWTNPQHVSVVPNGVPGDRAPSDLPYRRDKMEADVRILFLSTLSKHKGIFVLLRAIPLVLSKTKSVKFCIAGPWWKEEERQEAERWLDEHELESSVTFMGQVVGEAKRDFLRNGDVFVFASLLQEGQPLVVLEAMSAGLPVIASDTGCLRETVLDGETGFLFPRNDHQDLAQKISRLIDHPELRQGMGGQGSARFETEYTSESFVRRMEQTFLETLQESHD